MRDASDEAKEGYLRKHLEAQYGVTVVGLRRLDRGVFDTQLHGGRRWVTRVFSDRRPIAQVEGDAAVLRSLEQQGFPAERCANASPVSNPHGWGVLVTEFIDGAQPDATEPTLRAFGELLARLHALPATDGATNGATNGAVARPAGALHHYVPAGGTPGDELVAAAAWLEALDGQVPSESLSLWESLQERLAQADASAELPLCIIHPDPVFKNLLASGTGHLTLIDWTGAGRGPRVFCLGLALWSCALAGGRWSPTRVDAFAAGYRTHIQLEPDELRRLAGIMRIRPLVFACWRFRHAVRSGRAPSGSEWWWPSERLVEAISARARCILSK